jgi:integrase
VKHRLVVPTMDTCATDEVLSARGCPDHQSRPERKRIDALSADEVESVISAVGEHRMVDVLELCLECALRVGESIGLTWDRVHLDADAPWATIDRQRQCLKGTWLLDEPKRRSVRVVGLSRRACEDARKGPRTPG